MIISRTPFRISFAGGGSDIGDFYQKYGGSVLSATIDKYIYLSIHPYFYDKKFFLKYSDNEHVGNVDQIKHRIIREVFKDYNVQGVDFNSSADVPAGTGLGSSSAFTVGLINLCNVYNSIYMSKEAIANYACEIEINRLGEPIGKQDQYAAAVGGLNFIEFYPDDSVICEKVILHPKKLRQLQDNLLMFFTGIQRKTNTILKEQKQNMNGKSIDNLKRMVKLSKDLKIELLHNNIDALGEIMHQGWMYKKELANSIANEKIDKYYEIARENGAIGGKLLGAGGGGFLLFYAHPENHDKLRQSLADMYELKFEFDNTGTTIIYYD